MYNGWLFLCYRNVAITRARSLASLLAIVVYTNRILEDFCLLVRSRIKRISTIHTVTYVRIDYKYSYGHVMTGYYGLALPKCS